MFTLKKQISPIDNFSYIIPQNVIADTEKILCDYAQCEPSNEGLVYWAGVRENNRITILSVIAPHTVSTWGSVSTSNRANFDVVKNLSDKNQIHLGQVHSHPGDWVDHSDGDDADASFKIAGMLSIVVPNYCKQGFSPITNCGIHRYDDGYFSRLSESYISQHFVISNSLKSDFLDLRK